MRTPIITPHRNSVVQRLGPVALAAVLLTSTVWPLLADSGDVIRRQVGHPDWKPVDFHIFAAPVGTFESGFAEFGETMQALLPPPNHLSCADLGVGPGSPHAPPYDGELAAGVANAGFEDKAKFHTSEFSLPSGIWAVWMNVPERKSATGSSPDFSQGPIIPNELFPIWVEGVTLREGEAFNPFLASFAVPPLTDQLSCPFNVDGQSHFPVFIADAKEFGPADIDPSGHYEFRIQMRDQTGSGWDVSVRFRVTEQVGPEDGEGDEE